MKYMFERGPLFDYILDNNQYLYSEIHKRNLEKLSRIKFRNLSELALLLSESDSLVDYAVNETAKDLPLVITELPVLYKHISPPPLSVSQIGVVKAVGFMSSRLLLNRPIIP